MIVSSLNHLIDEVRAAFLRGVPYYSPVRVSAGFLGTKLSKIQFTLDKGTKDSMDLSRPVTACFYSQLPHYNRLTKREALAAWHARDEDPKRKEVDWDFNIEAYVLREFISQQIPYCGKVQRTSLMHHSIDDFKNWEDLRILDHNLDPLLERVKPPTQARRKVLH